MPPSNLLTARAAAAKILKKADPKKTEIVDILADFQKQTNEPQRTTDLVFGTVKNRFLIDKLIEKISSVPLKRISANVLNIIRIGIYELVYCPQTAEYAIVNEAVDYSKKNTGAKQGGFVNAVLRQTLRHIADRQKSLVGADLRKIVPQSLTQGCEFDFEILPDPDKSIQEYLSSAFSLPNWLVQIWMDEYGTDSAKKICFASNRKPSVYLRPNLLKLTAEKLFNKLKEAAIECEIEPQSEMIKLTSPKAITALPGFNEGFFVVQDLSSSQVVRHLNPQPGWKILDLCSAPGTKTTQLAEAADVKAKIVASDIDSNRLKLVDENISRLGMVESISTMQLNDVDGFAKLLGGFDCILVDAPCSNTGVLARRPEVRYRVNNDDVKKIAKTQKQLLLKAAGMLNSKGIICYSTCSILPQENGLRVRDFIKENPQFKIQSENLILPSAEGFDHDGSYTAILAK